MVLVGSHKVSHPTDRGVGLGPAQPLKVYVLAGNRFDYLRPGDEHVADALGHDDKVGQARGIDRATSTRSQHHADLRNHAAGLRVAPEKLAVAGQAPDPFLDACTHRIVEADKGGPRTNGQVQHLADLLGLYFRKGSPYDGKVLGGDGNVAPVYPSKTNHSTIAGDLFLVQSKGRVTVGNIRIYFLKGSIVEQSGNPFPGGQLSFGMLPADGF